MNFLLIVGLTLFIGSVMSSTTHLRPPLVGGFSQLTSPVGDEQLDYLNKVRPTLEQQLQKEFQVFDAVAYSTQIVAGMNMIFQVKVDNDEVIHVKVFVPLAYTGDLPSLEGVRTGLTLAEPVDLSKF